jgi:hypothetical protein
MSFAQTGLDNIALHKQKGNVLTLDLWEVICTSFVCCSTESDTLTYLPIWI